MARLKNEKEQEDRNAELERQRRRMVSLLNLSHSLYIYSVICVNYC